MQEVKENIDLETAEKLLAHLSVKEDEIAEISLPKTYKNKNFFEIPSYIQFLSTWFRRNKNTRIILPFGRNEEMIENPNLITDFFHEEPNYVAVILGWNGEICDKNHENIKPIIRPYTLYIRSQMNSLYESSRLLQKGNILFLTCFDHFAETNGLLNSFYVNRNTFFPANAFEFSPFVERLSFFTQIFNKEVGKKNLEDIFSDVTGLIYELMSNTHSWARTDENKEELNPNVRGVYLKFHKASMSTFLKSAGNHPGLNSFFDVSRFTKNTSTGASYFLEISVFDSGPGFIRRYQTHESNNLTINQEISIIKKCLTLHNTSAEGLLSINRGVGLDRVQRILDHKGLIRIRTSKCCLYRDMYKNPYKEVNNSEEIELFDWKTNSDNNFSEMPLVEGTLISIILPLDIF